MSKISPPLNPLIKRKIHDAFPPQMHDGPLWECYSQPRLDSLAFDEVAVASHKTVTAPGRLPSEPKCRTYRRLGCPRASKHSSPSVSLPSYPHVQPLRKKRWLSSSPCKKKRPSANSKSFAGRAFASVPLPLCPKAACLSDARQGETRQPSAPQTRIIPRVARQIESQEGLR